MSPVNQILARLLAPRRKSRNAGTAPSHVAAGATLPFAHFLGRARNHKPLPAIGRTEGQRLDGRKGFEHAREKAIAAERARCMAIMSSKGASARPDLAAEFAFHTDLSAADAIAALNAAGATSARERLLARIAHERSSATESEPTAAELAAQVIAAGDRIGVYSLASTSSEGHEPKARTQPTTHPTI